MAKTRVPSDRELTDIEIAWRNEHDPKHTMNLNQIKFRMEQNTRLNTVRDTKLEILNIKKRAALEREQRKKEEEEEKKRVEAEYAAANDLPEPGKTVPIEKFLEIAEQISGKADVDDLTNILHANLVIASQKMDLRPQDFISAIKMLRDMKLAENPPVVIDPYEIDALSAEERCELFTEMVSAHFYEWHSRHDDQQALWLIPFFDAVFRMIFLDGTFDGLVKTVANKVEPAYAELTFPES